MKHGKRDANHAEIIQALRDAGISAFDTADVGHGFPDIVASGLHRGNWQEVTALFEVKTEDGRLTPDQIGFIGSWRGTIHIVHTPAEALAVFGVRV